MDIHINDTTTLSYIENMEKIANEILELKKQLRQRRPIYIEFCGCPKSGKTSCINSLNIFLKRNGFRTSILTERASICPVPDKHSPDFNIWTACAAINGIIENLLYPRDDIDIVISDRGIFDALCWFQWLYDNKNLSKSIYDKLIVFFTIEKWTSVIDLVYVFTADPNTSIEREYSNLLTRKPGSIMNEKALNEYKNSILKATKNYKEAFRNIETIDTSKLAQNDVSFEVTQQTLNTLKNILIERIGYVENSEFRDLKVGINDYEKFKSILDNNLKFDLRTTIESSNFIQPIPIAVITNNQKSKVLVLKKNKNCLDGNSAEKDKYLIYAGGHIREEDRNDMYKNSFEHTAKNTLIREIKEELGISISLDGLSPFLIYSNAEINSKKHLAVCYILELDLGNVKFKLDSYELVQKSGSTKSGTLIHISNINQIESSLESWSKDILEYVFGKELKENNLNEQQVLF